MAKKKKESNNVTEIATATLAAGSKAVDVALQSLQKKFGGVVEWMGKTGKETDEIIPTGSLSLDAALGVGGIVKGRIYEFYGPNASGKTTLAISILKQAIALGYKALYIDAEHTLSDDLLLKMGIDLDMVVRIRGFTAEDNLDMAEALMATGQFAICVVDSISALQPAAEANLESFSDNTMGLHPRLMSRMCRTFTPLASRTKTSLILINQIRSNMGGYGNPETTSGGNAIQHHVSGRIRVYGGGVKNRQIKNDKGEVIGHRVQFEITKNKLAAPFRSAEVDLIYGKGFHTEGELLDLGVEMGLIDQAGAWFSIGEEKIGQGRIKAIETINSNEEIKSNLESQIAIILGVGKRPEEKIIEDEQAVRSSG